MDYKPTVVFDFDGVIHSYTSGWKGVAEIPDPPVPGIGEAIAELRQLGYRAVVVSTRCSTAEGMGAVRHYLRDNGIEVDSVQMEKPPALCYIDDRAIRFDGHPETLVEKVRNFRTWIEAPKRNNAPVEGLRPCKAVTYEKGNGEKVKGRFHGWGSNYRELVQHGHWKNVSQDGPCSWSGMCSACGARNDIPHPWVANYCPNCGARMDEEAKENDA